MQHLKNISFIQNDCFGCRGCEQICPKAAIKMIENQEGFLYPVVSEKDCVNCGLCVSKCPASNPIYRHTIKEYYSFSLPDNHFLMQSSSGGIAYQLSNHAIQNGWKVCGCIFNDSIVACHVFTDDLPKLTSSKYVQSDTKQTFLETRKYLDSGFRVLYFGTPCQIHGLLLFLGGRKKGLITVDLICHGVPSPRLFSEYIKYLSNINHSKVVSYRFRVKKQNEWGNYYFQFATLNGKTKTKLMRFDLYGDDFLRCLNYRESCYKCKYANVFNRPGDISIGDFWGVKEKRPDLINKNGLSSIIVNTEDGLAFLKNATVGLTIDSIQLDDVLCNQHNLTCPTKRPLERDHYYTNLGPNFFNHHKKHLYLKTRLHRLAARIFRK